MYNKTLFDNGVSIITERVPNFYSASIGIWVRNGSRYEDPAANGISHFIEHMLFKGTARRNALNIAREIDSLGGVLNAFTSSETTCYYVKVMGKHLDIATDLLGDILLNSVFDEIELERERQVILQEIRMVEDSPDDYIHDLFDETFWGNHPLGMSVLGNSTNVSAFTREDMLSSMRERYSADNIVITAAGDIDHNRIVDAFAPAFSVIGRREGSSISDEPRFHSNARVLNKELEQVHFCIGTKGVSNISPKRYPGYILNTILGGGMSSRLFQEVREKRGLSYSIYSFLSTYLDAGLLAIYAGTAAENLFDVLDLIIREMREVSDQAVSAQELTSAKEQIKGNMILGLESSDSRMQRLANNEIYFGRDVTVEELLKEIDQVKSDDVMGLAKELFSSDSLNIAVLGEVREEEVFRKMEEMRGLLQ